MFGFVVSVDEPLVDGVFVDEPTPGCVGLPLRSDDVPVGGSVVVPVVGGSCSFGPADVPFGLVFDVPFGFTVDVPFGFSVDVPLG